MHSFNYAGAVLVAILALVAVGSPQVRELRLVAAWSQMEYEFPSDTVRNQTIASGEYVPGAGVLIDTDIDYDGMLIYLLQFLFKGNILSHKLMYTNIF